MKTTRNSSSGTICLRRWYTGKRRIVVQSAIVLFIVILFWTLGGRTAYGQGVGISESSIVPQSSSILELRSTLRGFLAPRMTTAERMAIILPAQGLLVYDTDKKSFFYWETSSWKAIAATALGTANQLLGMDALGLANEYKTLNGSSNILVGYSPGNINLTTIQDIYPAASPTFAGLKISSLAINSGVYTDGFSFLTTAPPLNGNLGYWNRTGTVLTPSNPGDAVTTSGNISTTGSGTISASGLLSGTSGLTVTGGGINLNNNSNNPTNINTGNSSGPITLGNSLNTITLPAFNIAGVIHNSATGLLSSSLIVNNDISNTTIDLTTKVTGILPLANGGTNTNLPAGAIGDLLFGDSPNTFARLADAATGNVLISGGIGVAPSWNKVLLTTHVTGILPVLNGGTGQSAYTDGQLLIGNTAGGLTRTTLTGTANQINVVNGNGSITLSTPQNIHTGASPTFTGMTLSGLTASSGVYTDAFNALTSTPPTTGILGYWSRLGTVLSPTTAGDAVTTSGNISTTVAGTITSAGLLTGSAGATITGATTITGGAISLNAGSNNPTSINTGTSTGAVTIGGSANTITLPAFTTAGLVHNDAFGVLSTGLLSNGDITNGTIDLTQKVTGILPVLNGGTGQSTYTDGQLLIGNTAGGLTRTTLTGTANQINVANGNGSITLSTPQNIHTGASPTFTGMTLSGLTASSGVYTDAFNALTSTPPTTGILGYWSRLGTVLSPTTAGDAVTTSGNISTTGTGTITSAGLLTGSAGATITGGAISLNAGSNNPTSINTGTSTGAVTIGGSANTITLPAFTSAGLVHNSALGVLSTGLLSNGDITNGTIDLTQKVTGVLPIANGGTNSGVALSGQSIVISNGTAIVQGAAGTNTEVLHGNAAGAPSYGQIVNSDIANGTIDLLSKVVNILPVINGGTGQSAYTDGQLLIGNTAGGLTRTTLTGTVNQINVANGNGSIILSTPQNIHTGASPTFTGMTLSGLTASSGVYTDAFNALTSTPPTTGILGYWSRLGTVLSPTTAGDAVTTSGNISTTGTGMITSAGLLTGSAGATITGGAISLNAGSNNPTSINTGTSTGAVTIGGSANTITLPAFTSAGLVHNSALGVLSTGLLSNGDITNGTIDLTQKVTGILPVINGGTGQSTYTDGQLLIGNTAGGLTRTTLTGTVNQINVANGNGSIILSTPQNIHTGASPTFTGMTLSGLTASSGVYTDAFNALTSTPPTTGILGYWSRLGTVLSPTTAGDAVTTSGNISTTVAGTITSAGLLTGSAGATITGGAISLNAGSNNPTSINTGTSTGAVTIGGSANTITLPAFTTAGLVHNDAFGVLSTGLLSNGDITNGTIDLTQKVTGILPVLNGGTGQSAYTDGQLLIGNTAGGLTRTTLTGTANQINVVNGNGSITLSTPQNIHTGASPTFTGMTLSGLTASSGVYTDAFNALTSTPPTTGILGYWSRLGTVLSPTTAGDAVTTSGNISTTVAGTITSAGLLTGSAGATITGGAISLNAGSNNPTSINTGTSTGAVTIGGSANTITLPAFTSAGLVHNSALGVLSTGLLSNGDIANTTIDLTQKVTGVLPPANGGTGVNNTNTITIGGNIVTGGALTTGGAFTTTPGNSLTLTTAGATNVTLPVTGTLATLDGVEALTNKTINGNTITAGTGTLTISAGKTITVPDNATVSGINTGDVTLAGQNYLTLAGQVITAGAVDLSGTNATGTLAAGRFPALTGDVTTTAGSLATTISPNAVTYGKMQAVSGFSRLLGSSDAGTAVTEITLGSGLSLSGTTLTSTGLGGTVIGFTSGDLAPVFTTSVSNPTTTPSLSFALTNAGAYTLLGNNTGGAAAPTYFTPVLASSLFQNQGSATSVLHGNGAGTPSWSQIVDADVNATAAIAGTKISPNFGAQNVATTGNINGSAITASGNLTATSSLNLNGATSGTAIVTVPAIAGTPTLTLPITSGTLALLTDITNGTTTNFSGSLLGDVSGTQTTTSVDKIKGVNLGTTTATVNNILIADGSAWQSQAMSGDITILSTGATLIGAGKVDNGKLASDAVTTDKILNGTIIDADVNAAAAIAGTKISPNFGAQNVATTGNINGSAITASGNLTATSSLNLNGATSGTAIVTVPAIAGTPTLTLPITSGTLALLTDITNGTTTNFSGSLLGDVSGTQTTTSVDKIKGVNLGTTTATANNILIADGSAWQSQAMSGDITISNAGVTTIGATRVTNGMLAGSIAASKLIGTDIGTVGTITLGTWNAGIISGQYGGTGVNNGARTITLGGNLTTSGAFNTTLTVGAATNVTLPASGTLATLAGNEALTNKTINGNTITSGTGILTIAAGATLNATANATVSGTNTGDQTLAGLGGVPTTRTVNGKSLASDITLGLASADYANQGATTSVLHGNAAGNPSWGQIVNGDIDAAAGIAYSKLANLTSGNILVGSATNVPTSVAMTGDVTISNTGATTIGATKVTNGMLAGSIASSKLVGTDIATVGTVTAGTWNAGVIAGQYGGTGVNNTGKTITLGGNLTTSGAFATTLTVGAATNVTLPASGTLATLAGNEALTNKTINGNTITSGTGILTIAAGVTLNATANATVSGTNTGDQTLAGLGGVPTTRTVNGKSLASDITLGLASTDFSNQGTTTTLLHGNGSGAPSFGQVVNADIANSTIDLTTKVTGILPVANGGTAATTKTTAFDALSPMTTLGDIIYGGASGTGTRLAAGTAGYILTSNGAAAPSWQAPTGTWVDLISAQTVGGVKTFSSLPIFSTLTAGSIPFAIAGGQIAQDNANLFWNNATKRLGIGTATPTAPLDVVGDVHISATGSTTAAPREIGLTNWGVTNLEAARFTFGDAWNTFQNAYNGRMQITSYHTIDLTGNRQNATPLAFVVPANDDVSVNVLGSVNATAAPILAVTGAAGQTGNLQIWRNSGGTVLASVSSGGNIASSGSILSSITSTAGIGYATGAGGAVTQITSKSTPVTLNRPTGRITMYAAEALANAAAVTFRVTNSTVTAYDVPTVALAGGTTSIYFVSVTQVGAGYFDITVVNYSGGTLSDGLLINFAVINAVNI